MSYTKDRDRHSRGVGAIAARDLSPGAKRRFAKRTRPATRSMGDAPTGECSIYANGAYYVRRLGGQVEKVSPAEAAKYPLCSLGANRASSVVVATPTVAKTGPKYTATPVITRPTYAGAGFRLPTNGGYAGPVPSSTTPVDPYVVLPPSAPPPPSSLPPPIPTPLPPKPLPPPKPIPPRAIVTAATPTTSTPAATTSVVTTWIPPVDTSVTSVTDASTPTTTPTAPSSSNRNLLIGAGIGLGLLYLLTRK